MACGCPSEQCTCFLNGDAFTGGNGSAGTPYTVENLPFAPTSPTNSVTITPGGVKNHTPAIDVALSSDPNNAIQYDADGLLVDPCDMVDTVVAENALTCGPDGLLVDRCDILTPTIQALGDILIAGPDCTAQVMADPTDVDQIIAAQAGQWGQRPLLSADGGNASSIGTDGGIFSPSFGAAAPVFGVQYFNTDGTVNPPDGPIVWVESTGLPNDIITMPPAIIGAQFDIYNLSGINRISIDGDAADTFVSNITFAGQLTFDLPPGYAYRLTCLSTGEWYAQQLTFDAVIGIGVGSFSTPLNPLPDMKIKCVWATDTEQRVGDFVFRGGTFPRRWYWVGGSEAHDADSAGLNDGSVVYVTTLGGANNPTIVTQAPGTFVVSVQARVSHNTANFFTWTSVKPPSVAAVDDYASFYQAYAPGSNGITFSQRTITDVASGNWEYAVRVSGGIGGWSHRRLSMTPEYITL